MVGEACSIVSGLGALGIETRMLHLVIVLVITLLAAGAGLALIDLLGSRSEATADTLALAMTLGLGMVALTTLLLGELGMLGASGWGLAMLAGALLVGREAVRGWA